MSDLLADSRLEERRSVALRRKVRRAHPRIVDPTKHPRPFVCLRVAAEYLGLDERTVRARIEEGRLHGTRDGKVYRIAVAALMAYERGLREA